MKHNTNGVMCQCDSKRLTAKQDNIRFKFNLTGKDKLVLYFDIECEYCPECEGFELKRLNPSVEPILDKSC